MGLGSLERPAGCGCEALGSSGPADSYGCTGNQDGRACGSGSWPSVGRSGRNSRYGQSRNLVWVGFDNQAASMSTRGINIIVPNSNYYIQYDHPQVVIDAIDQAVSIAGG